MPGMNISAYIDEMDCARHYVVMWCCHGCKFLRVSKSLHENFEREGDREEEIAKEAQERGKRPMVYDLAKIQSHLSGSRQAVTHFQSSSITSQTTHRESIGFSSE